MKVIKILGEWFTPFPPLGSFPPTPLQIAISRQKYDKTTLCKMTDRGIVSKYSLLNDNKISLRLGVDIIL